MKRFCILLALVASPSFAQIPFSYAPPTAIDGLPTEARRAYMVHLDAPGSPIVSCWKNGGLLEKACSLLGFNGPNTAGFYGFRPGPENDNYDLQSLVIKSGGGILAEPEWSVPNGCVAEVVEDTGSYKELVIDAGGELVEHVRCNTSFPNLLGRVCEFIDVGDCGTFEGLHGSAGTETIFQIIARKGVFSY
jgi:hypothetical protein